MSGPVPLETGEAFFISAQHREAVRSTRVGISAAQPMHWNRCEVFLQLLSWQVASAAEQSRPRFPTMACALRIRRLAEMQEANAYFGKELVLKQAKLLDFTAAIRPA